MPPGMSHIQDDEGYIQYVLCTLSLHIGGACTTSFLPTSQVQRFCLRLQMQSGIQVSISEYIPLSLLRICNPLPALKFKGKTRAETFFVVQFLWDWQLFKNCPNQVIDGNCKQNYQNLCCRKYISGDELAWDECCCFWTITSDLYWLESLERNIFAAEWLPLNYLFWTISQRR